MKDDSGNLSIDFLVGFTVFLIAFIWVVSMIPGLLVNLQGYTIDYDAVAYRTGVILAEDPGEPSLPSSIIPWENLISRDGVVRFGLAISKDSPNILSRKKVDRFFCMTVFSYPGDYQNRTIFGDYPYQFNISLIEMGSTRPSLYVGDDMPPTSSSGSIRRLVRIKEPGFALINASSYDDTTGTYDATKHPDYLNGDNETVHEFSIVINKTELLKDKVKDETYQINPGQEQVIINITNLDQVIYPAGAILADRRPCFNINLTSVKIKNEVTGVPGFLEPPLPSNKIYIDNDFDHEYNASSPRPFIINNITLILDPPTYWSVVDRSHINLTFELVRNTGACPLDVPLGSHPEYNFTGSRFLNNTFTAPFAYNYNTDNVIQPHLQNGVLEVKVKSGARTITAIVVEQLEAAFKYEVTSGMPNINVQFIDLSKGNPVDWEWDFNNDGTVDATTSNPSHTYTATGTYIVTLTVKDAAGNTDSVTHNIVLLPPAAAFSPAPMTGTSPLELPFTDSSTGAPTSWRWEYSTDHFTWTQFSTDQNPVNTFTAGTYDIRLTASNLFGSNAATQTPYVVNPALAPTFTSITPATGPTVGGTPVTIVGTNFVSGGPFGVTIGGAPATSVVRVDATHITAVTPAHAAGAVDVVITNFDGQTATGTGAYTYVFVAPPTFTSIAPAFGPTAGGTPVTIVGTNFVSGGSFGVTIGGTAATGVVWVDATHITAVTPAHAAGAVDVVITNNDGQTATGINAYTYGSGVAPAAAFSGTPLTGNSPLLVTFTDASTGTGPFTYAWDFNNDGTVDSTVQNPTYTYNFAGTYSVRLTVTGPGGTGNELKTAYITVYTVETFRNSGTWTAPPNVTAVQYLVVGGGGGGGSYGAGGGGGGFRTATGYSVTPLNTYTVTVGTGGAGGTPMSTHGSNGGNSAFAAITATGGGGGGGQAANDGNNGGSGGGARSTGAIGAGIAGQGNSGGRGHAWSIWPNDYRIGGGGGGASATGGAATTASPYVAGAGGAGQTSSITGTTYACGGGGGGNSGTAGSAGCVGAGAGSVSNNGAAGTANTGGGGGGGGDNRNGGAGGSGIVIIRYTIP